MHKKLISLLWIVVVCISFTSTSHAFEKDKLLIWSKAVFGNDGLKELGRKFERETGYPVEIYIPDGESIGDFNRAVVLGKGPDIYLRPHDRIGELAKAGMLAEIEPSASTMAALDAQFWNAVSFEGNYYGYPLTVEGPTQICNAELTQRPFESFQEILAQADRYQRNNQKPILWDYLDTYFNYGFFSAEGGYAFPFEDGTYNTSVTGLNHRGTRSGIEAIKSLYDAGILPKEMNYQVFDEAFKQQRAACVINGPWAWAGYKQAGIELQIANYPKIADGEPKVFIGVLAAIVNSATVNKVIAKRFIEDYLLQPSGLKLINDDEPMGAVTHKAYMRELAAQDPLLAAAYEVWKQGEPMPNVPKMGKFWTHAKTAIANGVHGKEPVAKALEDAALRVTR